MNEIEFVVAVQHGNKTVYKKQPQLGTDESTCINTVRLFSYPLRAMLNLRGILFLPASIAEAGG